MGNVSHVDRVDTRECAIAGMWREYDIKKLFIGEDPRAQRLCLRIKIPGAPKSK